MSEATRGHILNELTQISKTLQDIITTSIARKRNVDGLIHMMNPKVFLASTSQAIRNDVEKDVEKNV